MVNGFHHRAVPIMAPVLRSGFSPHRRAPNGRRPLSFALRPAQFFGQYFSILNEYHDDFSRFFQGVDDRPFNAPYVHRDKSETLLAFTLERRQAV